MFYVCDVLEDFGIDDDDGFLNNCLSGQVKDRAFAFTGIPFFRVILLLPVACGSERSEGLHKVSEFYVFLFNLNLSSNLFPFSPFKVFADLLSSYLNVSLQINPNQQIFMALPFNMSI
jgi:hypothetical protein